MGLAQCFLHPYTASEKSATFAVAPHKLPPAVLLKYQTKANSAAELLCGPGSFARLRMLKQATGLPCPSRSCRDAPLRGKSRDGGKDKEIHTHFRRSIRYSDRRKVRSGMNGEDTARKYGTDGIEVEPLREAHMPLAAFFSTQLTRYSGFATLSPYFASS